MVDVRGLRDAGAVHARSSRSTPRCATRAGLFDVSHMGEIELTGPGAVASVERLVTLPGRVAAARPRALRPALQRERRRRRRRHRLPPRRRRAVPVRERLEHREGLPLDRAARAAARRRVEDRSDATACSRSRGPRAPRSCRASRRCRPRSKRFRFVRGQRRRCAGAGLAHRLHGRGRLRALRRGAATRVRVWNALLDAGRPLGPAALRPRRARHAAPRSRAAALRPRARRHHLAARGGPRALREARAPAASSAPRRSSAARRRAATRALAGFVLEDRGIARAEYPIAARRRTRRRRDLRRALADARKVDRARLRSAGPRGARHADRDRDPRARGARRASSQPRSSELASSSP